MKNLVILFFCIFFSVSPSYGQQSFSKMFDLFGSWESAINIYSLNQESKEILMWGDFTDQYNPNRADSMAYNGLYFAKIDSNLKLHLHNTILKFGFYIYAFSYLQINTNTESKFLIFGTKDTLRLSNPNKIYDYYIINLNTPDSSPFHNKINTITSKQAISSTFYLNNKIYLFGKTQHLTTAPFAILCIDTTGKQLWYKTYPGKRRYANSVVIDDEGNFIIAGSSYKGDGGAFDTTSGWYAKLDTAGNFIWEKEFDRNTSYFTDVLSVYLANSNFYLSSNNDASYFDAHVKDTSFVSLFKINEDGDIEWYKRYLENPYKKNIWAGRFIERNNFAYGIGGYITDEGWQNYTQYSMLVKVDLSGNLIWKRIFKQWHRDNRFFSLTPVPDGFIICADGKDTTHTTGFNDAWIIKTDTNGCIVPGCHITDGLVQLTNPDAFVTVYPNPATDKITVQITDTRAKIKSYLLYDAKGNFINQQPLSNHPETVEIVTNNLSAGNYYLVIELVGGERAVKKIMIQR